MRSLLLLPVLVLLRAGRGAALSLSSRRSAVRAGVASAAGFLWQGGQRPAHAKQGDVANFGLPSASEADAALGGKADTYGDASRANSVYAQRAAPDDAAVTAKRDALVASAKRFDVKIRSALEKNQWSGVTSVLDTEMYAFKQGLSFVVKAQQGGKVCLIDPSQVGAIPKGYDPSDCPLQLLQMDVLQDLNGLYQVAGKEKDIAKSTRIYDKFLVDWGAFLAKSKAVGVPKAVEFRRDMSY